LVALSVQDHRRAPEEMLAEARHLTGELGQIVAVLIELL
jgi:hypothetical protein